ncbi:SCO family protein [Stenotrophomonas rhizophila]|uniref:SCO family protein n=1 Tax=Stenotrophomonas rhizophila TaxID=216778 RepID=UPI001E47B13B|nr:SCO family protein [Stenotrophomonas rhizophila]MCC7633914.1 SCO family protein [Stenotrophomonas rhizophila]MCC7663248.1 SCO family protein [Stenotrophomonas rhizophila]
MSVRALAVGLGLALLAACSNEPAPIMGRSALQSVALHSSDGRELSIGSLRGRPTLLFFGFTHCPEVCPLSLLKAVQLKQRLGPLADSLQVVFVTVDPRRDTPAHLRQYLAAFDPAFIGLAGDEAGTRAVAESLGVSYRQVGEGETATFEHTASWFLLGADGTLQEVLGYALSDAQMEARLRARLASNP